METVTVSSKYQLVIPRAVRERIGIEPGQQVQIFPFGNRIEVVPVKPGAAYRGMLQGLENDFERERDRL